MTDTTATPAPGTDTGADSPAHAPADWTSTLDDAGKAYVSAKGFKAPTDALAVLQGYEPPAKPEDYALPVPDGESPEFAAKVAPLMHKAGLSKAQANALASAWNEMQTAERAAQSEQTKAAEREADALAERQHGDLKREWGDKFDANVELSRRAIRAGMGAAGLTDDNAAAMIDTLEKAHGFGAVHKFFAVLGAPFAEGAAHGLSAPAAPSLNPQAMYDKSNMNP